MQITGHLRKMLTSLEVPVQYHLPLDEERVDMNSLIGQPISLNFVNEIHCLACGRKTSKSFNQGYCYPCFKKLAQCDSCIIKPELCHYDQGSCREPEWGEQHCLQDHIVYLANSSAIKVGITRSSQIPTRWIDQGASSALPIFRVKNRLLSGRIEVILKQHISDRTDWRKMLRGKPETLDLADKRDALLAICKNEIDELMAESAAGAVTRLASETPVNIEFPVNHYPAKVSSFNFDKTPEINGVLNGIKGQYLILDSGVLNIRKFGGYRVRLQTMK
ncbi:FIG00953934: hypothetical protein [hydrothermal vent metagenome]|uniref:DUF2797 domain-containing protein n=1 Tax=hydrothermal vent metagenome TaxID=652676 RepID=A0A3B1BMZ0_9ZZZZ